MFFILFIILFICLFVIKIGHEEYHIAHSFFFSGGCVYLLLFDCSFELEELISKNKLVYWLHFLQTQIGKEASFILIGTKLDVLENKFKKLGFLNQQKLNERLIEINNRKKNKKLNY